MVRINLKEGFRGTVCEKQDLTNNLCKCAEPQSHYTTLKFVRTLQCSHYIAMLWIFLFCFVCFCGFRLFFWLCLCFLFQRLGVASWVLERQAFTPVPHHAHQSHFKYFSHLPRSCQTVSALHSGIVGSCFQCFVSFSSESVFYG